MKTAKELKPGDTIVFERHMGGTVGYAAITAKIIAVKEYTGSSDIRVDYVDAGTGKKDWFKFNRNDNMQTKSPPSKMATLGTEELSW